MSEGSSKTNPTKPAFSDQPRFTDVTTAEAEDYRTISRTAVCALVLGLLSPLALVHPLWCSIPWAGMLVAWQALRRINQPNSMVSGRTVALIGLLLTVLFGSWAPARHLTERKLLARQAQQFAQTWLDLVRNGHLQEAHRWMLPPYQREPGMPTQLFYEQNVHLEEDLETEFTSEPANLIAAQPDSTLGFLGVDRIEGDARDQVIVLKYVLQRDNNGHGHLDDPNHIHKHDQEHGHGHTTVHFFVRVRRVEADGQRHWQLSRIYQAP